MKNIISASRRTDIPAFYMRWFADAYARGNVQVANPLYPKNIKQVSLRPADVVWIVFWSRNYQRFLKNHNLFSEVQLFFHFTILTPSILEKLSLPVKIALKQMENLVKIYGPGRIIWRYDPIVHWFEGESLQTNYDPSSFAMLCVEIGNMGIKKCYTSFAGHYRKFRRRFVDKFPGYNLHELAADKCLAIGKEMLDIATSSRINLYSCCNDDLLVVNGIKKGRCIDGRLLNRLHPQSKVSTAKIPSREQCGCTRSIDIGSYTDHPCNFGCIYCYANPLWK